MLFALNICVNKKAPPTHSVHWGLNPTSKTSAPSFLPNPFLNLQAIQAPLFRQFTPYVLLFMHLLKSRIFPVNSHNIKIYHPEPHLIF